MITPEIRINTKCPVPTGTDCSINLLLFSFLAMSRPYGDGLFCILIFHFADNTVPSLRGRIVPRAALMNTKSTGPVPTGTDCSQVHNQAINQGTSRPYGDGLFHHIRVSGCERCVPSLRGRIVPKLK